MNDLVWLKADICQPILHIYSISRIYSISIPRENVRKPQGYNWCEIGLSIFFFVTTLIQLN